MSDKETLPVVQADGNTALAMLQQAVSSNADVEVLERLVALQERWQAGEARRAFTAAISAVRSEMPEIVKTKEVDFPNKGGGNTNYKYEDLGDMTAALNPALSKHGLSWRWRTDQAAPGFVSVTCIIEHADGHAEETTLNGPYDTTGNKNAIQAIGSVTTYLQRYTLKAALGIAASSDDDGRQGTQQGQPSNNGQAKGPDISKMKGQPATDGQVKFLRSLIKSSTVTDEERTKYERVCARVDDDPSAAAKNGDDKAWFSQTIDWWQKEVEKRKAQPSGDEDSEDQSGSSTEDVGTSSPDDEEEPEAAAA